MILATFGVRERLPGAHTPFTRGREPSWRSTWCRRDSAVRRRWCDDSSCFPVVRAGVRSAMVVHDATALPSSEAMRCMRRRG